MNKHKKIKQFEELEITDTYKESPQTGHQENQSQTSEMNNQTNTSFQVYEEEQRFDFNVVPIKVVALTAFLFTLGSIFLIVGIVFFFRDPTKFRQYISLLLVGGLMLLPGVYYTCLLIKFARANNRSTQQKILNELPID